MILTCSIDCNDCGEETHQKNTSERQYELKNQSVGEWGWEINITRWDYKNRKSATMSGFFAAAVIVLADCSSGATENIGYDR